MKILFDTRTKGHHVEYIHHIYMMMVEKRNENYVIIVPEDIKERTAEYEWPYASNINFDLIPSTSINKVENGNFLLKSLKKVLLLKKYINKYNPSDVFLVVLIGFIPFLPFFISKKTHIIGIIYKIYLYEWVNYSFFRKFVEILKYKVISCNNCISNVMILNDASAALKLNKLYNTNKFGFIPDPYNRINYEPQNIREKLGILESKKMFIHFGSLSKRKGTLIILEALNSLPTDECNKISIVIAGIVRNDIRKEFYELIDCLKEKHVDIQIFDEFCSNEFIANLCYTTDFVLIPYEEYSQSSGIIAHAVNFNVPVIGPSKGLIGKIIKKYKVGILLNDINSSEIAKVMINAKPYKIYSNYCEISTVERFQHHIDRVF